jgi:WD40 repeat protein
VSRSKIYQPGLSDWEWHYLQRRTHRCLHTLRGHTQGQARNQNLRCVVYRPDARLLAAAGDDGTITVWDGTPLDRDPSR